MIEAGEFDYMHPSAECYRQQMLTSIEKFGGVPFDYSRHTHVCLNKVKYNGKSRLATSRPREFGERSELFYELF